MSGNWIERIKLLISSRLLESVLKYIKKIAFNSTMAVNVGCFKLKNV